MKYNQLLFLCKITISCCQILTNYQEVQILSTLDMNNCKAMLFLTRNAATPFLVQYKLVFRETRCQGQSQSVRVFTSWTPAKIRAYLSKFFKLMMDLYKL